MPRGVGVEPPSLLGPLALPQGLEHLAPDVARRRRGGVAVAESLAELGESGSRKGDRSAGRRSAASLAACASLSSRCLAPKPVASGNVSLSLMKRSSSLSASVSSQSAGPAGSGRTSYKDPHSMAVAVLGAWESSSGRIGRNPKSTAPNMLAMVLSNVAERCVTVGGGARLGSRAFTELGHPSSSPLSSGERRVLFFPGAEGRAVSRAAAIAARVLPCVCVRGCVDRVSEMLPLSPYSIFAASPARVCFPMASPFPIAPGESKVSALKVPPARACYFFCLSF